jgi:hypothetical protein
VMQLLPLPRDHWLPDHIPILSLKPKVIFHV